MRWFWQKVTQSRFLRDMRLVGTGTLLAQIAMIVVSPLLPRLFSPEDFGIFAVVVAIASILTTFSSLRLDVLIPFSRSRTTAVAFTQFVVLVAAACAVLITIALLVFRTSLAPWIGVDPSAPYTVLLLPAMIVVLAGMAAVRGLAVRGSAFRAIGRAQIVRVLMLIAVSLALGYSGLVAATGAGLIIGQLTGDLFFTLWLLLVLPRPLVMMLLRIRLGRIARAIKTQKSAVAALSTTQMMAVVYERAPIFAITAAYGPIYAGFYALAARVAGGPASLVASAFDDVFRQRASKSWNAGKRFDGLIRRGLVLTLALSAVPALLLIVAMPNIIVPIFGPDWADATYTMVLMFAVALFGFNSKAFDKTSIILEAHRFIYVWHSARMTLEVCAAALALANLCSYEVYLAIVATGRAALYVAKLVVGSHLAKTMPLLTPKGSV